MNLIIYGRRVTVTFAQLENMLEILKQMLTDEENELLKSEEE